MKTNFLVILLLSFNLINVLHSQVSSPLGIITEGDPNNLAGLGYSFTGEILEDGKLYFRGSNNGQRLSIWSTDGTASGTSQLISEPSVWGGQWRDYAFLEDGVLVNNENQWGLLKAGQSSFIDINGIPDREIIYIEKNTSGDYYFTTDRDDTHVLFRANSDFSQVDELGFFHNQGTLLNLQVGNLGALIFSENIFVEDTPMIYLKDEGSIVAAESYLTDIGLEVSKFESGFMHDRFLIVSYKDLSDNSQYRIINTADGSSSEFEYFRDAVQFFDYNNTLFYITETDLYSIDKTDLSYKLLYEDVYPFSYNHVYDGKLYFIGRAWEEPNHLMTLDMENETITRLPNTDIGQYFYDTRIVDYKDEVYYLKEEPDHYLLLKYNEAEMMPDVVDTLGLNTGAGITFGLQVIGDHLVYSRRIGLLQHELFVYNGDGSSLTSNISMVQAAVQPTVTNDEIKIVLDGVSNKDFGTFTIFSLSGVEYGKVAVSSDLTVDVGHLPSGQYLGVFTVGDEMYQCRWMKF